MRKYKRTRWHKIKMWFYWLTVEDVKKGLKIFLDDLGAAAAIGMIFILLCILPHFFH